MLEHINKKEDGSIISLDELIKFLLDNVTQEQKILIQNSSITWIHEEKRLKKIWSKKNVQISEAKWKQLLFTGALIDFIHEHARSSVLVK